VSPPRYARGASGLTGIVLVDKPAGITSHDVVNRLRWLTGEKRIGHAGTLDPMATGLLVMMVGKAAGYSDELTATQKTYRATITFGVTTDTDDAEGAVIETAPAVEDAWVAQVSDEAYARTIIAGLVGAHEQVPPAYSAIKQGGKKAYREARKGHPLKLEPRRIVIEDATLLAIDTATQSWDIELTVSKGTYIRAIARDLGTRLGCGAHLSALRRMRCGEFAVEDAVTLEALEETVRRPWELADYFISYGPLRRRMPASVAIGVFDGCHRGHQEVLRRCVEDARANDRAAVMMTFDPFPEVVMSPTRAPQPLMTREDRIATAKEYGIDEVLVVPFTSELAQMEPEEFVRKELLTRVNPLRVFVGENFRFGIGAQGTPTKLAEILDEADDAGGTRVQIVEAMTDGDAEPIASTRIRRLLGDGDVEGAATLLGRPFALSGVVTKSRGIGAAHGRPTINVTDTPTLSVLDDGVYAGQVIVGTRHYDAAIFVGIPTNATTAVRTLEAHLLDFTGDLQGTIVTVIFERRLRDNIAESDEDMLTTVIAADIVASTRKTALCTDCCTLIAKNT